MMKTHFICNCDDIWYNLLIDINTFKIEPSTEIQRVYQISDQMNGIYIVLTPSFSLVSITTEIIPSSKIVIEYSI